MVTNAILVNPKDPKLAELASAAGLNVTHIWPIATLSALEPQEGPSPELLVLDIRSLAGLPPALETYKRRHPTTGIVVIAAKLEVELLRDAMRMGVGECLAEPVTEDELGAAVRRVIGTEGMSAAHAVVLGFTGAKCGVGTTTVAVNTAAALAAHKDASVVFLDLHIQDPGDAAIFFGIEPRYSVVDALENLQRLDSAFFRGLATRAACGVDVIAAPALPPAQPPKPEAVRTLVQWLFAHYRHVVIDMPRLSLGVLDALEPMTVVTLVASQELSAVRSGTPIAALLRQRYGKERVNVVLNRYDSGAEIGQEDIERIVGLPIATLLPSDYASAVAAANTGHPLVSTSHNRLAKALIALAERLGRTPSVPAGGRRPTGILTGSPAGLL